MAEPMESDPPLPENPEEQSSVAEDQHQNDVVAAPSDSASDSESDSDDEEAQDKLLLETLESELSTNPSNYEAHVQYIRLLRKSGEFEKLKEARVSMSQIFPLGPSMWQEWAKDETLLSSEPESVASIEQIYERGVCDYLSVSLWCDYVDFVQAHDPSVRQCSSSGIAKARSLFERAITAAGLHFTEGSKIWEAYREFELAILLTVDESDLEGKGKQVERIRSIFHRQLSVPLADLSSTLLAYKAWEVEQGNILDAGSTDLNGISSHVLSAYQRALDMYNARVAFEEHISTSDVPEERLPLLMRYLKFEESSGDPARVQILYERAITEFPISGDLWLEYMRYLDKTLKAGVVVKDAYHRATRNCPWVGELWVRYLLCLERAHASEEEISGVFEKALQCTFSSYEEYLDLFLTRIDGLRRRISVAGEMQVLDYAVIRDTFHRASDYLSQHMKGTDGLLRLHAYWAQLELRLAKDIVAARGVWESLLKISGTMLEAWKSYIAMEIENENINEARSVYRRCYTKRFPGFGSEDICHSWLQFERQFGKLEDYDYTVQKVSPRLEELKAFRSQQESKSVSTSAEHREQPSKKSSREKRKSRSDLTQDWSPAKKQKDMGKTPKQSTKKDPDEGPAKMEKTEAKVSKPEKMKYSDKCTAFISNLSLNANYEDIRKFFSDVGGIVSIRVLKDKYTGKSRGLAYVDFTDDAHLEAAVKKNKRMLLGKKLSVARSDPKQSKKQRSGAHTDPEKEGPKTRISAETKDSTEASNESMNQTESSSPRKRGNEGVQLIGKNTFAMPRAVKPLGWTANKPKASEDEDEKPKSNDEFRKMLLKN